MIKRVWNNQGMHTIDYCENKPFSIRDRVPDLNNLIIPRQQNNATLQKLKRKLTHSPTLKKIKKFTHNELKRFSHFSSRLTMTLNKKQATTMKNFTKFSISAQVDTQANVSSVFGRRNNIRTSGRKSTIKQCCKSLSKAHESSAWFKSFFYFICSAYEPTWVSRPTKLPRKRTSVLRNFQQHRFTAFFLAKDDRYTVHFPISGTSPNFTAFYFKNFWLTVSGRTVLATCWPKTGRVASFQKYRLQRSQTEINKRSLAPNSHLDTDKMTPTGKE